MPKKGNRGICYVPRAARTQDKEKGLASCVCVEYVQKEVSTYSTHTHAPTKKTRGRPERGERASSSSPSPSQPAMPTRLASSSAGASTSAAATQAAGAERALVLGNWEAAADLGLAALAGGSGGAAAARGACVGVQALYELGR
jgi:hypothetical protein